jgi:hypothetical protein
VSRKRLVQIAEIHVGAIVMGQLVYESPQNKVIELKPIPAV